MGNPVNNVGNSHKRRRWLWVVLLLALPFCLLLLTWGYVWWAGNHKLDQLIADLDREDPTWRQIRLDRRPIPPPAHNGMDQVLATLAVMPKLRDWPAWPVSEEALAGVSLRDWREAMTASLDDVWTSSQFHPEQMRVLRSALKRAEAGLPLARRLVEFPNGGFQFKPTKSYFSVILNHVQETRGVADLLEYDAYVRAQDGDVAGALHNVRALIHASRAIGDEPFLMSQLVRQYVDGMAVATLQRILGLGVARDDDLKLIQALLLEEAQTNFFLIGARGERAHLDEFIAGVQHGELTWTEFRREMVNTGQPLPRRGGYLAMELYFLQAYASIYTLRAELLAFTNAAVQAGNLPETEQLAAFAKLQGNLRQPQPWIISHLLNPFYFRCGDASLRGKALLRTATAGVASERFRLTHGRWPTGQAELVPSFLPALLKDPYDGEQVRFKRTNDGLVIYSVGSNLVDDGGNVAGSKVTGPVAATDADVGFLLFDVEKRRLPPRPLKPPLGTEASPGTEAKPVSSR
jgi:hypothetical protein